MEWQPPGYSLSETRAIFEPSSRLPKRPGAAAGRMWPAKPSENQSYFAPGTPADELETSPSLTVDLTAVHQANRGKAREFFYAWGLPGDVYRENRALELEFSPDGKPQTLAIASARGKRRAISFGTFRAALKSTEGCQPPFLAAHLDPEKLLARLNSLNIEGELPYFSALKIVRPGNPSRTETVTRTTEKQPIRIANRSFLESVPTSRPAQEKKPKMIKVRYVPHPAQEVPITIGRPTEVKAPETAKVAKNTLATFQNELSQIRILPLPERRNKVDSLLFRLFTGNVAVNDGQAKVFCHRDQLRLLIPFKPLLRQTLDVPHVWIEAMEARPTPVAR